MPEIRCHDSLRMKHSGRYRDRLVERLRDVLDSQGSSVAAAEKKLGRGRGYVADALRGDKKLSVEVIIEVLEAIGVAPEDFFERATPTPSWRHSEIAEVTGTRSALGATLPPSMRDASTLLQAVVLLLAERGVVSVEDLHALQRDLGAGG